MAIAECDLVRQQRVRLTLELVRVELHLASSPLGVHFQTVAKEVFSVPELGLNSGLHNHSVEGGLALLFSLALRFCES